MVVATGARGGRQEVACLQVCVLNDRNESQWEWAGNREELPERTLLRPAGVRMHRASWF